MELASQYNPDFVTVKTENPINWTESINDEVVARKEDSPVCDSPEVPMIGNDNFNSTVLNPENGDQIEMFPKSLKR